ncbi:MAG TPA: glycosyltransferase [Solirubrobacteraceae bacterium]|nr:glycosyltransferase [Solirubrobacteraceae bacterium]
MRITVVVPTYKRAESLRRCLDSLAEQELAADEILVVARADDDATHRVVSGHAIAARLVTTDRPGVVAAMNAGIDASTGELVALTDDDSAPHADWLRRMAAAYESDARIGAVGGRDWVHENGRRVEEERSVVGTISWYGRFTGNHHLGAGAPRDVAVLKGVNLSMRGELIRELRIDTRLRGVGTEHHWELALCLGALRKGYRVVYDPAIAVEHFPQPRVEGRRSLDAPLHVRNATHNETLAVLEHLPVQRRIVYLLWTVGIGTSTAPGLAQAARSLLSSGDARLSLLGGALKGRALGVGTYLSARRVPTGEVPAGQVPTREVPIGEVPTEVPTGVFALGHSPSAKERIEQLLADRRDVSSAQAPSGWRGVLFALQRVARSRAHTLYLVDVGMSTTAAAVLGRALGRRVVLDTGDAVYELARSLGDRSRAGLALVGVGERVALRSAHQVVVRGRAHAELVGRPATHIPDLAPASAAPVPTPAQELRAKFGLEDAFVVGLVGSVIRSPRLGISYGWDLVEALAHTGPQVSALIVGDGSGLEPLRLRAAELGVSERCRFVGRVPTARVSEYVSAMDAAISTQTNDVVGQVRTTSKLPLYLACGCPVIATHVGEAALLLGPLGWTLRYDGVVDERYPERLAELIETWRSDPAGAPGRRQAAVERAAAEFDVATMRARLAGVLAAAASS